MALAAADSFNVAEPADAPVLATADNFNQPGSYVEPPTDALAEPYSAGAYLTWTRPVTDPGYYTITASEPVAGLTREYTISDPGAEGAYLYALTNAAEWTLTVYAVSEDGENASSGASATVTPDSAEEDLPDPWVEPDPSPPDAPVLDSVTEGDTELLASWSLPYWDGGETVTSYVVELAWEDGLRTVEVAPSPNQATVGGLTNGTEYTVSVTAINSEGVSTASNELAATPVAGLPALPDPIDTDDGTGGTPRERQTQPVIAAFTAGRAFAPSNWIGG